MALPYLLLEAIGQGSTALGGTCSQRMSALGHKATCAPQKIMSALPRKRTFAVNSPCLLCAKSRHTSLRLSFLLSAIGRHIGQPRAELRDLCLAHMRLTSRSIKILYDIYTACSGFLRLVSNIVM
jgi:hypothetical protein